MSLPQVSASRCFLVRMVAVAALVVMALCVGVHPSGALKTQDDGTLSPWLTLLFATSMSVFGFSFALSPSQTMSRIFRVKGWIFAIGGLVGMVESVADLLGWLH